MISMSWLMFCSVPSISSRSGSVLDRLAADLFLLLLGAGDLDLSIGVFGGLVDEAIDVSVMVDMAWCDSLLLLVTKSLLLSSPLAGLIPRSLFSTRMSSLSALSGGLDSARLDMNWELMAA